MPQRPGPTGAPGSACSRKLHTTMEMNERMSKRWWLLGVGVLVSIGALLACGSNYSRSQDGLLLVGSKGSGLIETFSFTLSNGHVSAIANSPADTANKTSARTPRRPFPEHSASLMAQPSSRGLAQPLRRPRPCFLESE